MRLGGVVLLEKYRSEEGLAKQLLSGALPPEEEEFVEDVLTLRVLVAVLGSYPVRSRLQPTGANTRLRRAEKLLLGDIDPAYGDENLPVVILRAALARLQVMPERRMGMAPTDSCLGLAEKYFYGRASDEEQKAIAETVPLGFLFAAAFRCWLSMERGQGAYCGYLYASRAKGQLGQVEDLLVGNLAAAKEAELVADITPFALHAAALRCEISRPVRIPSDRVSELFRKANNLILGNIYSAAQQVQAAKEVPGIIMLAARLRMELDITSYGNAQEIVQMTPLCMAEKVARCLALTDEEKEASDGSLLLPNIQQAAAARVELGIARRYRKQTSLSASASVG